MADGRNTRARRRRAQTEGALLDAARTLFRHHGYHATTVEDIVQRAQVARGTFYLYFRNKEAVLGALVGAFVEDIRGAVRRIETGPCAAPPAEQIRENLRRICHVVERHEDVAALVFLGPAGFDDTSRGILDRFWERTEAMVRDALAVGQGLGVVRSCDRALAATMALGAVRAALSRRLAAPPDGPPDGGERFGEAFIDEIVAFPLRGLLALP